MKKSTAFYLASMVATILCIFLTLLKNNSYNLAGIIFFCTGAIIEQLEENEN